MSDYDPADPSLKALRDTVSELHGEALHLRAHARLAADHAHRLEGLVKRPTGSPPDEDDMVFFLETVVGFNPTLRDMRERLRRFEDRLAEASNAYLAWRLQRFRSGLD